MAVGSLVDTAVSVSVAALATLTTKWNLIRPTVWSSSISVTLSRSGLGADWDVGYSAMRLAKLLLFAISTTKLLIVMTLLVIHFSLAA